MTSHQTHYRSYRGHVFTGQMTQPTVSQSTEGRHMRGHLSTTKLTTVTQCQVHMTLVTCLTGSFKLGKGVSIAPSKPEPCQPPPNVLVTAAVCSTNNNNYFFKHNLIFLPLTFRSLPEIFVRRSLFTSSSSSSCHGSDVTWQENGRTYGSVCSSLRHG